MRKPYLASKLAKKTQITHAEAADQLDGLVNQILDQLKAGKATELPGLGSFKPDDKGSFQFEKQTKGSDERA